MSDAPVDAYWRAHYAKLQKARDEASRADRWAKMFRPEPVTRWEKICRWFTP